MTYNLGSFVIHIYEDPDCTTNQLSWPGHAHCPFCSFGNQAESCFLSCWPSLWNGLALALCMFPVVLFNSYCAHLKIVHFSHAGIGIESAPE